MWFFCLVVAVAFSNDFYVNACLPLTIGHNIITANATAYCTSAWHIDAPKPSIHPGYKVSNNGQWPIKVSLYWKDSFPLQNDDMFCEARSNCYPDNSTNFWYELPNKVHIQPLEMEIIRPPANVFYFTRLVVVSNHSVNSSDLKSDVFIEYADEDKNRNSNLESMSLSDNLKAVLRTSGSRIPSTMTSSGIDALIELFWPENKTNIWDEVLNYIRYLIDRETFAYVNNLVNGLLIGFKSRLVEVAFEIRAGQSDVSHHYMNIAEDLIGFGDQFFIRNHYNAKRLNFDLLPLYSNVVSMKALFYSLGLACNQTIGLTWENMVNVRRYLNNTIRTPKTGANDRLLELFKDQQEPLTNCQYDRIMFARNALREHGYSPMWNNLIDRPGQKFEDDGIIFSQLIGAETSEMLEYARSMPKSPLIPDRLPDGTYAAVDKVEFFAKNSLDDKLCIVGTKVIHKNGFSHKSVDDSDFMFSSTVQFRRITSINIQTFYHSYYTLSVGVRTNQGPVNHTLGLLRTDQRLEYVTLAIPTGYKVAGMLWDFDNGRIFKSFAVSFEMEPYLNSRFEYAMEFRNSWISWQC